MTSIFTVLFGWLSGFTVRWNTRRTLPLALTDNQEKPESAKAHA
jgi:hypothetical protein